MYFLLFGHIITLFSSDNKAALAVEHFFVFMSLHYGSPPYAMVCYFHRQAGWPDNGNYLESGEVRGNMRVTFFHTPNEVIGTLQLVDNAPTLLDMLIQYLSIA